MGLRTEEEEEAGQSRVSNITSFSSSTLNRNNHHHHQQNQIQISIGHCDVRGDNNNGNGGTTDRNDVDDSIGGAGGVEPRRWWCRLLSSTYILCVCSFLVSLTGGAILVVWESKFHPSNRQLWMVPVGLILFGTPVFIWFSALVSDLYCCPQPPKQLQQNTTSDGRS